MPFLREVEKAVTDGNLIEYHIICPSMGKIRCCLLIVDEAHM